MVYVNASKVVEIVCFTPIFSKKDFEKFHMKRINDSIKKTCKIITIFVIEKTTKMIAISVDLK